MVEYRQTAPHERYRACTVNMGLTIPISSEVGQFATILYRLQEAERRNCQGRLPNSASRRVSALVMQITQIFYIRR